MRGKIAKAWIDTLRADRTAFAQWQTPGDALRTSWQDQGTALRPHRRRRGQGWRRRWTDGSREAALPAPPAPARRGRFVPAGRSACRRRSSCRRAARRPDRRPSHALQSGGDRVRGGSRRSSRRGSRRPRRWASRRPVPAGCIRCLSWTIAIGWDRLSESVSSVSSSAPLLVVRARISKTVAVDDWSAFSSVWPERVRARKTAESRSPSPFGGRSITRCSASSARDGVSRRLPTPRAIMAGAEVTSMIRGPARSAASITWRISARGAPVIHSSSYRFGVAMSASGINRSRSATAVASGT